MKRKTEIEQDQVTVKMTREQYADLTDSLDALASHLDDLTKLEAVVNCFRDQNCLYLPLGEVLRELKDDPTIKKLWHGQAKHKHRDLANLIARVRTLCCDRGEGKNKQEKQNRKALAANYAA